MDNYLLGIKVKNQKCYMILLLSTITLPVETAAEQKLNLGGSLLPFLIVALVSVVMLVSLYLFLVMMGKLNLKKVKQIKS